MKVMKIKIKEEYKGSIMVNGVNYNLGGYNDEKLQMIYDSNPQLRFMFEVYNEVEGIELPASLEIETPEEFNELVEEVIKDKKRKKK